MNETNDEEILNNINAMCYFVNPNNFDEYNKYIYKGENDITKNYFYVSEKNINFNPIHNEKNQNLLEQRNNKIINKGKKHIKNNKDNKRERDYMIIIDDEENEIIEESYNNNNKIQNEALKLVLCPICLADIRYLSSNKKLKHLITCQNLNNNN